MPNYSQWRSSWVILGQIIFLLPTVKQPSWYYLFFNCSSLQYFGNKCKKLSSATRKLSQLTDLHVHIPKRPMKMVIMVMMVKCRTKYNISEDTVHRSTQRWSSSQFVMHSVTNQSFVTIYKCKKLQNLTQVLGLMNKTIKYWQIRKKINIFTWVYFLNRIQISLRLWG